MLTKWSLPLRDHVVLSVLLDLRDLTVGRVMTDHKVHEVYKDYQGNLDLEDSEENLASKASQDRLEQTVDLEGMESKGHLDRTAREDHRVHRECLVNKGNLDAKGHLEYVPAHREIQKKF